MLPNQLSFREVLKKKLQGHSISRASGLKPETFVGGGGVDPALPAALGSAIIHGPQTQPWTESYRRLQAAQATCALSGTSSVERGLRALLNPDDAARLALAAWENSSASSEVLNRVLDLIRQTIDAPGVA